MTYEISDRWVWDFWFARDGDDVHVFHLQAPRSLGDPDLRHHRATVGHAVSQDLRTWTPLPDALHPGALGEFDDLATWTGSVVRSGETWHMFYTGISHAEQGRVQRVGHATSSDLTTWTKHGMVLEADARWYERLADGPREEAWRDPWVWWEDSDSRWHMMLTARAKDGAPDARGVIGHAWSHDLVTWEAGPPLSAPGEFYHLEVPQLLSYGGRSQVLFCAAPVDHSAARRARGAELEGGTHYLVADTALGPYEVAPGRFLLGDAHNSRYAGRVIEHDGASVLMTWENVTDDGTFVGRLSDPVPLDVTGGQLRVISSADARAEASPDGS